GAEKTAAWFISKKRFYKIDFKWEEGYSERFEKYHIDPDKKLIILCFHFHVIEIIGRYKGQEFHPFTVMYQKKENDHIEDLIKEKTE
ncbi:LPS biosynthesis protein, partial [Francisella tularensis subsp. holarctica]|nr:LPS biosynthesis protein [Francisella tularensis subsp. holarctica]